jgi:mitochondrial protein MBA1
MVSTLCVASNSLFVGTRSKLIPRFLAPLSIPTSITSNTCQCRSFSQTHVARAKGVPQRIPMKQSAQPSLRTLQRKQLATDISKFPDLGVLQGTFIRPLWRDMPSIFQKPRERLQMEWLWLKSTFMHFVE